MLAVADFRLVSFTTHMEINGNQWLPGRQESDKLKIFGKCSSSMSA